MTAGGPPWPVFGAGSPEPEAPEAGKAAPPRARPVKAGPPWARQTSPEPVRESVRSEPPWPRQSSPEPLATELVVAEPAGPEPWAGRPEAGAAETEASRPPRAPRARLRGLSARLTALTRLIQIGSGRTGSGGFSEDLLRDAEALVDRAGERLRMSAGHTVVALAGGTGSGKSALFNQLAGHDFSAVGVTRPVTREPHACVWGASGSGPLLEWLGVPRRFRYGRGSVLDGGESALHGLILLDLPDHDSVVRGDSSQVDRLVGMADLMVWVLDPQKYADAAVHRKYLVPLAGHSEVIAVVLNQSDLLTEAEAEECVGDLRRLLDAEGLHEAAVLVTSAVTGAGVDQLRKLLTEAVSERKATSARISADVDGIAEQFALYAIEPVERAGRAGHAPGARDPRDADGGPGAGHLPAGSEAQLVDAFSGAAGVSAVGDALQSARELRAIDFVGWPIAWLAERLTGRDPVRRIRLGRLWAELRSMSSGPSGAQQADVDHALTKLADEVCPPLPKPWSQTTRSALRSQAGQIPAALGAAVGESLPAENKIVPWWRLVGALQGLLLGCVIVGLAWIVALLIFGVFHAASHVQRLFSDASLLPWIIVLLVAFLFLGWLTAAGCVNLVRGDAVRERARVQDTMRARIGAVARELVLEPAERELAEYRRFVDEFEVVAGR